ncbi:MAG TPA: serine/threonine-protein kinase [Streptosporangiaceae bacterium]|nr:serine/threonine-protein kinase [Streptosporangiaceae bacterium]
MAYLGAVLGGRYVLDEQIGFGGYGEVWRATDTVLSRPVALKLLHQRHAEQAETVARFRSEAQHAASLSHENIAQVFDYGEAADGQPPYLVMELVAGASLEAVLKDGPLDVTRTMDIVAQTAAGLRAAHAAGMIHRDVKPGNLLLNHSGTVKVTDFGLAHTVGSASITISGELVGTPGYLAPERAVGEKAGPASDLYSLGIVAYECLTGARPFTGTQLEVAMAHRDLSLPPLPASVAADVTAFVMRLTAKDPGCRPRDAAEVTVWAGLLRDGIGTGPVITHQSAVAPPLSRGQARYRAALVCSCAAVAAVIVIVVASVIGFASPWHPVTASSAPTPSSSAAATPRGGGVTAPSSHRPAATPAQPPAARPADQQQSAPVAPVARTIHSGNTSTVHPGNNGNGPGSDSGLGTGNGPGNGPGTGNGPGNGSGNGNGNGNGKDKGNGKAQGNGSN